ncbi:Protein pleiotropic regulatory locus 1 [Hibiscus syriacus]|uniref:Protein pleiotropic regulatory locus 1 n=1 Tax=Hibiscus syriacus TaxID=106335 RepID=A0A6A3BM41_HIBSY|nr:Protein pleiotropic regulatory locus 1 [Hibiscus syriacus]
MPGQPLDMEPVEPQSLKKLSLKSLKRALDLFSPIHGQFADPDPESKKIRLSHKINVEYSGIKTAAGQPLGQGNSGAADAANRGSVPSDALSLTGPGDSRGSQKEGTPNALVVGPSLQPKMQNNVGTSGKSTAMASASAPFSERLTTSAIIERIPSKWPRPVWHRPWKNYRVISGHLGWVRSVAFDPSNNWFCTGSADRTIKIWDVASGRLKLTLTGHIEQIRGLAVSSKHTICFQLVMISK